MHPYETDDDSSHLADKVDDALEAMWHGESAMFDALLSDDDETAAAMGQILSPLKTPDSHPLENARSAPFEVGNYRIIRELGRGGMGVVYEAEQLHPRRRVALKVIRGGVSLSEMHIRLFEREVQSLGRLKHPGIGAIYDAGRTSAGEHYFAMELVQGVPLVDYCNRAGGKEGTTFVSLRQRIELFCQVCEAIHYAHQRGVIHRDLKPSNILVTDEMGSSVSTLKSRIKVLDFGLAHITDADIATTIVTETGRVIGTLRYMSPEQAQGDVNAIDIRSDVYSLGVILYEMITGQPPYDVSRTMPHRALKIICEESPRKPSTVNRTLRGDLETIVLKALEKDPERRYQSAAAMGLDLHRHLTGQTILARPPSTAYQFRKLVARHKLLFSFLTTVFFMLIVFSISMTAQRNRARQAERRAEEQAQIAIQQAENARIEAAKSQAVSRFMTDMLFEADPSESLGEKLTVLDVVDQASRRLEHEFAKQPLVRASLHDVIGNVYMSMANYEPARRHLQDAFDIYQKELGDRHDLTLESMNDLAMLKRDENELDRAWEVCEEALRVSLEEYGEANPTSIGLRHTQATILRARGEIVEAEQLARRILDLSRELYGDDHIKTLQSINMVAMMLRDQGQFEEAERMSRQSFEGYSRLYSPDHPTTLTMMSNWGGLLAELGELKRAETILGQAIERRKRVLGVDHPRTLESMNNLASVLKVQGDLDRAVELFRETIAISREKLGEDHPNTLASMNNLAGTLRSQGKFSEAEEIFAEVVETLRQVLGPEHPNTLGAMSNLAVVYQQQNKLDQAERILREVSDRLNELLGDRHISSLSVMNNLAGVLQRQEKFEEARELFHRVVTTAEGVLPEGNLSMPLFRGYYGSCLLAMHLHEQAEQQLLESFENLKGIVGLDHPHAQDVLKSIVRLYNEWDRPNDAQKYESFLKDASPKAP